MILELSHLQMKVSVSAPCDVIKVRLHWTPENGKIIIG